MSKKSPKVEAPPTASGVIGETIRALPNYYSAMQQYQPLFNALNLGQIGNLTGGFQDILGTARQGDLGQVNQMAGGVANAYRTANPDKYALLGTMNQGAQDQLALGGSLSADQTRNMQQASRAAAAARGLSGSNMAIADEMYRQFDLGNTLQQQRQNYALGVGGLNQAATLDPFSTILGMGGPQLSAAMGQNNASNPMNQLLPMAHDNQMSYWNAKNASNTAGVENKMSMVSGAGQAGATLGAAALIGV